MLGHFRVQRRDAFAQVIVGDKLRMLARHEQDVAEALRLQRPRLAQHFVHRQRHAQDRVVAREAAVFAVVDALVGKVKRREQADDLAEPLLRERVRPPAQCVPTSSAAAGEIRLREIRQRKFLLRQTLAHRRAAGVQRTFHQRLQRQRIEFSDKAHEANLANRGGNVEMGKVAQASRR